MRRPMSGWSDHQSSDASALPAASTAPRPPKRGRPGCCTTCMNKTEKFFRDIFLPYDHQFMSPLSPCSPSSVRFAFLHFSGPTAPRSGAKHCPSSCLRLQPQLLEKSISTAFCIEFHLFSNQTPRIHRLTLVNIRFPDQSILIIIWPTPPFSPAKPGPDTGHLCLIG